MNNIADNIPDQVHNVFLQAQTSADLGERIGNLAYAVRLIICRQTGSDIDSKYVNELVSNLSLADSVSWDREIADAAIRIISDKINSTLQ